MSNPFQKAEKKSRRQFAKAFSEFQIEFQSDTCRYDAIIKGYAAELKHRNHHSEDYDRWLIEKDKYDALQSLDRPAIYFNSYTNGVYRLWDLSTDLDLQRTTIWAPKTTVNSGPNERKPAYLLPDKKTYET